MDNKSNIKKLIDLSQLDIDAVNAYEVALKHIDKPEIHQRIEQFRQDHLRHISELNDLIRQLGGEPPELTKDLKGYLIEGMTALRSVTGSKGALKAMETNEMVTNKSYSKALQDSESLPEEARLLLQKNYGDEQAHLSYIKEAIDLLESSVVR